MKTCFDQNDPEYPIYSAMIAGQRQGEPNLRIAADDRKYLHAEQNYGRNPGLMAYFRAGLQTSDAVQQLVSWHYGPAAKVTRFLDFACGYGRFTRFLKQDLGAEHVWAADIRPDAVEFVRQQFGVQTLLSTAKPENFRPGILFDCIYAGSLFSHLPEISFTRWLWKLYSLLAPGGLLIFSVHGESAMPAGVPMPGSGIHFVPTSEVPSPDLKEYGDTIVADGFVLGAICAVTGLPNHKRIQQGLNFSQDLYALSKGKLKDGPVPFQFGPIGCVDFGRWTDPGCLKLSGWAFDQTPGEHVVKIEIYYAGMLRGDCRITGYRPDVAAVLGCSDQPGAVRSGWECLVDVPDRKLDAEQDWLLVKAVSSSGRQFVMLLDHPVKLTEFEAPQGWTYSPSDPEASGITAAVRYIYLPHKGRFTTDDPELSGWIATTDQTALEGVKLEGRFGEVPFIAVARPDVSELQPGLVALGFQARLPPEYFTVADPRLRFITKAGNVLCALDTKVEPHVVRRQDSNELLMTVGAR